MASMASLKSMTGMGRVTLLRNRAVPSEPIPPLQTPATDVEREDGPCKQVTAPVVVTGTGSVVGRVENVR